MTLLLATSPNEAQRSQASCNDKPELGLGSPGMDDFRLQNVPWYRLSM